MSVKIDFRKSSIATDNYEPFMVGEHRDVRIRGASWMTRTS